MHPLVALLCIVLAGAAAAAPQDLDPTFGSGGIGYVGHTPEVPIWDFAQQRNGRLLALVPGNDAYSADPALWRLNADGAPDATFAVMGKFGFEKVPRRPGYLFSPSVLATPDALGRSVVAIWEAGVVGSKGSYFVSVTRVLADGTLDTGFGDQGKASVRVIDDGNFPPSGIVVQADGRIVVATTSDDFTTTGRPAALVRFLADGTPDASFGTNGYLRLTFNAQVAVLVQQPDGKLLVAGSDPGYPPLRPPVRTVLARLLPDGQLDDTFADAGIFRDAGEGAVAPRAMTVQQDLKILIAGSALEQMALLRLDAQGRLDTSFGTLGRIVHSVEPDHVSEGSEVAVDSQGRIVVAGSVSGYTVRRIAVARFQGNGAPDLRFAGAGSTTFWADFGATATGVAIGAGDSIVLAGGIDGPMRYFGAGHYLRTPRPAFIALKGGEGTIERPVREAKVVEYFNPDFGHYFISSSPDEIGSLDIGLRPPWTRTGRAFRTWSESAPTFGAVCRFFSGSTFAPKSSHFFTPYADECNALRQGADWQYEGYAFYLGFPAGLPGKRTCAEGTVALYRAYNNGRTGAPNHRYTTDRALLDALVSEGWTMEGEVETSVFACVPAP